MAGRRNWLISAAVAAVVFTVALSTVPGSASPPISRGEQFFPISVDECMARALRAFQGDGWTQIQPGGRYTAAFKDIHSAYITCNDAGNGQVVVNVFVASDRGDGGVPGAQRERLQTLMAGGAAPAAVTAPPAGGQVWLLSSNCGAAWDGTRPNFWTAIVTMNVAADGTVSATFDRDALQDEFRSGRVTGNTLTMTLHPVNWASVLQLTGTISGPRIDGTVHHYGGDDCAFTMVQG